MIEDLATFAKARIEEFKVVQEKRMALLPKFETEEDALAYAKRIANIQAGDKAKIFNEDATGLREAIFTGHVNEDGVPMFLTYDEKNKMLCSQAVSWHAVVLD